MLPGHGARKDAAAANRADITALTVMLLPASRLIVAVLRFQRAVPEKLMFPVPGVTVSAAAAKLRPACKVTDQPAPATMPAPVPMVILLPASSLSRLPGALMPVLATKSQSALTVMLFRACKSICEKPVKAEFTFSVKVPAGGISTAGTVPEPALPLPVLPMVMLSGSIKNCPARAARRRVAVHGGMDDIHAVGGQFHETAVAAVRAARHGNERTARIRKRIGRLDGDSPAIARSGTIAVSFNVRIRAERQRIARQQFDNAVFFRARNWPESNRFGSRLARSRRWFRRRPPVGQSCPLNRRAK